MIPTKVHSVAEDGAPRPPALLVVDDSPSVQSLIGESLEECGFSLSFAGSGVETLDHLTTHPCNLLLLDYRLPDMTGKVLVETLAAQGRSVPFILMTAHGSEQTAVDMMKLGAADYIVKDRNFLANLPSVVRQALHRIDMEQRLERAQRGLQESEERLRAFAEALPDVAYVLDEQGRCIEALTSQTTPFSREKVGIKGKHLQDVLPRDQADAFLHTIRTTLQTGETQVLEYAFDFTEGRRWFEGRVAPMRRLGTAPPMVVWVSRDVTERRLAEEKIQSLAFYDPLTGLPNRALLNEYLGKTLAKARRDRQQIGIIFLDLDHFKKINDTLGHANGDQLLTVIAERLKKCTRQSDILARLGGDEFVMILPTLNHPEDAACVATKILAELPRPLVLQHHEIFPTTSIGIAIFPQDGCDGSTLLKGADLAMYEAKAQGRNTYRFFSKEMNLQAQNDLTIESNLRRALERQELQLVYQPQFNLRSGRSSGMEALVRWNHPTLGILPPARFIPIAEKSGLIVPLGEWVLRTACSQGRRWQQRSGFHQRVAVNVSGLQLRQDNWLDRVEKILAETGFAPRCLEFEVTETTLLGSASQLDTTFRRLKQLGIQLAIDDFGTGYSSLSYLRHFPIDRLKIDRSFIREIAANSDDRVIVEAIIAMARRLRLQVIAEGVESSQQMRILQSCRCHEGQGFYLGRPTPADAFPSPPPTLPV